MTHVHLMKVHTRDGLELDGIASAPDHPIAVVVHVHGKCGNFYQNAFIATMLEEYPKHDIAFVSVNNSGHDCLAEAYVQGNLAYVGGSLESTSRVVTDLEPVVDWAEREHRREIFLQGHSYGCDKAVLYQREDPERIAGLVLLSPADSRELHRQWLDGGAIAAQRERLAESSGGAVDRITAARDHFSSLELTMSEYGVPGERGYSIPVTTSALFDVLRREATSLALFSDPLRMPACPTLLYLGAEDPLQTRDVAAWRDALSKGHRASIAHVEETDHHFRGCEVEVVARIADWIAMMASPGSSAASD